jgi:hypothetical protein
MRVALASQSEIKRKALEQWLYEKYRMNWSLQAISVKGTAPQPVNTAEKCARQRLAQLGPNEAELKIAIENGLEVGLDGIKDVCIVVAEYQGIIKVVSSFPIKVPLEFYREASQQPCEDGFSITVGECIRGRFPKVKADNWMLDPRFGGIDRKTQILDALSKLVFV